MTDKNKNIDKLTAIFFDAFTNTHKAPDLEKIYDLLIPEALIIKNIKKEQPEIYSIDTFLTPRIKILNNGTLTDFFEKETSNNTTVIGNIAQRISYYKKSGKLDGIAFEATGQKMFQFIKIQDEWKITSIIWSDDM